MNMRDIPDQKTAFSFLAAAFCWISLAIALCWRFAPLSTRDSSVDWAIGLSLFCLADLLSTAKIVQHLLALAAGTGERIFSAFRTSYWGALKIACWLILGTFLLHRNGRDIPALGLSLGISTLAAVPVLWGFIWYGLSIDLKSVLT
jgi:hypothetical protein